MSLRREENASFVRVGIPFANADISDILKNTFSKIPMNTLFLLLLEAPDTNPLTRGACIDILSGG